MAQKNRTKEIWLIPKRVNLHQAICLIDGILERGYDGTAWNTSKQDNLGASLKKWGATRSGKNISLQALRTLVAYVQYLGFVYIDTTGKNNTIHVTKAGKKLWDMYQGSLVKVKNLSAGKQELIMESPLVLRQMEKLQLTNPINAGDCENICLFPFRFLLRVLLETEYLDQEEIARILFQAAEESEMSAVVEEVERFRALSQADREDVITDFLATHIGNITLGQASSAGYFMSLYVSTGIVERFRCQPGNRENPISALRIKEDSKSYVKDMLSTGYAGAAPFDFGDDLRLWIDYIGDPDRDAPPIEAEMVNKSAGEYLVQIFFEGECRAADLVEPGKALKFPAFVNEDYEIRVTDLATGVETDRFSVRPDLISHRFSFGGGAAVPGASTPVLSVIPASASGAASGKTLSELADEIRAHCGAPMFAPEILTYLETLKRVVGLDRTKDKSLRGAYLEYDVYQMLALLKQDGVIDEVVWNGKRGKYGLPSPAPGGKTGTPDLVFVIGSLHVVTELTTIPSRSMQFSAEGSSVPDHIRLYESSSAYRSAAHGSGAAGSGSRISGVFCAPQIHTRNTTIMQAALMPTGIPLHCITVEELLELLLSKDRALIETTLG